MQQGRECITGLILAGGKGSRMNGQDKGLVPFDGRPLVEHVLERIRPQCADLVLSVNRNEEVYSRYGYRLVVDEDKNFPGPLAGIAAALRVIDTEFMVVAPCDSPFLPMDYAQRLLEGLLRHPQAMVSAARTQGHEQSVFMLIRRQALPAVQAALREGRLAVHRWLNETMHAVWVDFEDEHCFENLNRPQDLLNMKGLEGKNTDKSDG